MVLNSELTDNMETLVCDKGDIVLKSYNYNENNKKAYTLSYKFKDVNTCNVNINALLTSEIYNLLEKINPELVERIYVLKELSEHETDICIIFKPIAKELGIKQKYTIFRTIKILDIENKKIFFDIKDLSLIDNDLVNRYLNKINLNLNTYESMFFNFGKITLLLDKINHAELKKLCNNEIIKKILTINFKVDFQISINDELPIYMEDLLGLMLKKLFYNLKQFLEKINNSNI